MEKNNRLTWGSDLHSVELLGYAHSSFSLQWSECNLGQLFDIHYCPTATASIDFAYARGAIRTFANISKALFSHAFSIRRLVIVSSERIMLRESRKAVARDRSFPNRIFEVEDNENQYCKKQNE